MHLDIDTVYAVFAILSVAIFWVFPVRWAVLITVFGGWLCLPVGHYPPVAASGAFTWWITGLALPGEMLVSKAWIVPTVALGSAVVFGRADLGRVRLHWTDICVVLWCLWPLIGGPGRPQADPAPGLATLYLMGSWGALWMLGRVWFRTDQDRLTFMKACAWAGVACLPFAILEGALGMSVHAMFYGPHPFALDGVERYVGLRPVGMFEHGNQYGLWVSISAVAAFWLAGATRKGPDGAMVLCLAVTTAIVALAAQSVGALLLGGFGLWVLAIWRLRIIWPVLVVGAGCIGLAAALHLSGVVPLERIARETELGRAIVDVFRSVGRGSFLWRVSQDLKMLDIVQEAFVRGTMIWDWWRPTETRPWGLWLLVIGQYGAVGLVLAYGGILAAAGGTMRRLRSTDIWHPDRAAVPMAVIVVLAVGDSLLNAFFYFPALLAAGALVAGPRAT